MYKKNRNRGLAFVEMGSPEEALEALNNLESYVSLKHHTHTLLPLLLFVYEFVWYCHISSWIEGN